MLRFGHDLDIASGMERFTIQPHIGSRLLLKHTAILQILTENQPLEAFGKN